MAGCKDTCCGSPLKKLFSTLATLVGIVAIVLIAVYATRSGISPFDETHTMGTQGICSNTTSGDFELQIMSFNTFMINCLPGGKCQESELRTERAESIGEFFKDRDEDVVLLQELWSNHDIIRDGMTAAGFCHFVMTEERGGSGLAVFSKHPILENSFEDWADLGDLKPDPLNPETYLAIKGVLYTKVMKGDQPINVLNLHATSDSFGDNHDIRLKQFEAVKGVIDSKNIDSEELVLIGGDMNEDKDCRMMTCKDPKCENQTYYEEMLTALSSGAIEINTENTDAWTYNTENNTLLKSLYEGSECDRYQYLLDYIFYSESHRVANKTSLCEVIQPKTAEGTELSDHFPMTCVLYF